MASVTELITPDRQAETHSVVERIGVFASAAQPEHLTAEIRQLFKRNILDSIGCAIAAVAGPPLRLLRDQIEEYRAPGRCTLIGGGTMGGSKTSPDQAALFNSSLVRYVDLLDSYMAQGGLCHPSDNFGTVLAAAEYVGASGEGFMLALAVAYEIQCRFTSAVPVMAKGFNHATQLAISAAAGAGKLFGLSAGAIANAISIATVDKRLACKCACRTSVAVEGLLARNDRNACHLCCLVSQARVHRSKRSV
jgi:2-methylcitrate dehydratase